MDTEFSEFLNALTQFSENSTYDAFLPHAQQKLQLKQLNTEQFNRILAAYTVDPDNTSTEFYKSFLTIIHENNLTPDIDLKALSMLDIGYLILRTKQASVSDIYTLYFTAEELEAHELKNNKVEVSFTEHFEKNCKNLLPLPPLSVNSGEINVLCFIPTIFTEVLLEEYFQALEDTQSPEKTVENFFLKEITKYIQEISFKDKRITTNKLVIEERLQLIKQIPSSVINDVIKSIEKIKQPLNSLTTVYINKNGVCDKEHATLSKELPLTGALFNF